MRSRRENFQLILILGILNALTPFTIDLYLPAFPQIARDLGTSIPRVSLSVAIYFVGFALGQIIYGPLLDRFGRKIPLYFGVAIYLLGTLGCASAQSVEALLIFRFISALGGSALSVGTMTMVRDYFPAKDGAKVFSMLMLVLSASPLFAPSLGSFMVGAMSWRWLFGALAGLALVDLALIARALPLAYQPDPKIDLSLRPVFHRFRKIFRNSEFRSYTLAGSLSFAGLFVYIAGSPAIFMDWFKVSAKTYGAIFALLAVGMIGGGQVNHFLVRLLGSRTVFRNAIYLQVVAAAVFLALSLGGGPSLLLTVSLLFLLLVCAGIAYPNAAALALEPFDTHLGSASSLLGFLQLGVGAVIAALVGLVEIPGTLPMSAVMFFSSIAAATVMFAHGRSEAK